MKIETQTRLLQGAWVLWLVAMAILLACSPAKSDYPVQNYNPVVPAYGGAAPYYLLGRGSDNGVDLKRIIELHEQTLAELQSTNRQLNLMAGKMGVPVPAALPKIDRASVLLTNCASCHRPGNAKGDFILVVDDEGKTLKPLSQAEKTKVANRVAEGSMPPPATKKLTTAEKSAVKW